jgi:nucleotide-binding universal stress UspA family protein
MTTNVPTTNPPDDFPDIDVDDSKLTSAQKQQIKDLAQRMIDAGGNAVIPLEEWDAYPRGLRRRAWNRYQANFEDPRGTREKNAQAAVDRDNKAADKEAQQLARQRERREAKRREREILVVPIDDGDLRWDQQSIETVTTTEPDPQDVDRNV